MATRVSVHPVPQPNPGKPTVRVHKVQLLNDRGDRRAEARWLAQVEHSGIVRLHATTDDPLTIITEHAGSATLRTADVAPDEAAVVLADVALILADLHDASMAHGKLTLDHVILGTNGPVLCSPDGRVTDHIVDLASLATCLGDLERKWVNGSETHPEQAAWRLLADRLTTDPSMSARRAARQLRALSGPPAPSSTPANDRGLRSRRGLGALAVIVTAALGGLLVPDTETADAQGGVRVSIDGSEFEIGAYGDDAVVLERPCDPDARVLLLSDDVVWIFPTATDGQQAYALATVPGATSLITVDLAPNDLESGVPIVGRFDSACQAAQAAGPAGASLLRTWERSGIGQPETDD